MPLPNFEPTDLKTGYESINSQISALQSYKAVSDGQKQSTRNAGNSDAQYQGLFATQLNQISTQQKRFERNVPSSYSELLGLIQKTKGSGSQTSKDLRKILITSALKLEPEINQIVAQQAIKFLGCSQQQTYQGISENELILNGVNSLSALDQSKGVYLRITDIDFFKALTVEPDSLIGRIYYERENIGSLQTYKNYYGLSGFPMNYELWERTQDPTKTYKDQYQVFYNGGSSKDRLFDFTFTKADAFGNSGQFIRIFFIDRTGTPVDPGTDKLAYSGQTIVKSLNDYYKSIDIFSPKTLTANILNIAVGALSSGISITQIQEQTKFAIILNRILGLCESGESEIDVSGVAKVSELDVVDDDFFEFNQIDENFIQETVNRVQGQYVTYEECGDVRFPVNTNSILNELDRFGRISDGLTVEQQVDEIEKILDSIPNTWEQSGTTQSIGFSRDAYLSNLISQIPLALASSIFTPKVLLPLFAFYQYLQNETLGFANQQIVSGNTVINVVNSNISSANTLNQQANLQVSSATQFAKKFKKFVLGVVGGVAARFIEILFQILKRELLNLIKTALEDIYRTSNNIYALKVRALITAGEFLVDAFLSIQNYRECKSLVAQIQKILKLIARSIPNRPIISKGLIGLANYLPGTSPERAVINAIEISQGFGLPTGTLTDGQPNKMILYQLATQLAIKKEDAENGVVDIGVDPIQTVATGGVPVFVGKNR
jgi:hypothetical protein